MSNRFYFLQKEDFGGYGIFVEVFTKFSSGKYERYNDPGDENENIESLGYQFDITPGFSVGRKWINKQGFTFELFFGIGRSLLNDSSRVTTGMSLGKKF
jgi:hypothetical protein